MKKLMIATAIVCAAVMAQAGSVQWKTTTGLVNAGSTTEMSSGMLQLVAFATGTDVEDVFDAVKSGSFTAAKTAQMTDGKIPVTTFDYTDGNYDFYCICVDGDNFFISGSKPGNVSTVGEQAVGFALKSQSNTGIINDADKGYVGAGWYSTVPEPTSGLLLLLGVAGLALKRRRA